MLKRWRTIEEIDAEAKGLGAITKIVHSIKIPAYSYSQGRRYRLLPWSDHYFNQDEREIAYCIRELLSAGCGLYILPQPRAWDDCFLSLDTNTFASLRPISTVDVGSR